MFTGLIVELGTVVSLRRKEAGAFFTLSADGLAKDTTVGDSIAINGVCLTVVAREGSLLSFDISGETVRSTNLGLLRPRDRVNLEPSLRSDGRLGGHFVTGHVDAVGKIRSKTVEGDSVKVVIDSPEEVTKLLVEKGSVAVDGISLTVLEAARDRFSVVIIPHTARLTTIGSKDVGDTVNLEGDILGKYVAKFLTEDRVNKGSSDSRFVRSLKESGYMQEE
ncbi:MAG TPA: riboflavin synthase [Thermodesulfovibrionales bacterium]|nr:riboflavin synthase [Thermodesulfovibrionales bacterium]